MDKYILITIGAIVGTNLRYLIGGWAAERFGSSFPYGTFIINLSGSLLIGIFLAYTTERVLIDPRCQSDVESLRHANKQLRQ